MTAPTVVGLDLSLSSTGIADAGGQRTITYDELHRDATYEQRAARVRSIAAEAAVYCLRAHVVVIEGPAFSRSTGGAHERAGLWWRVYNVVHDAFTIPVAVVGPTSLKKYATGNGNAGKPEMLAAAIRRLGYDGHQADCVDALWLRAAALDWYGHPLCPTPAAQRAALEKVAWPDLAVTS